MFLELLFQHITSLDLVCGNYETLHKHGTIHSEPFQPPEMLHFGYAPFLCSQFVALHFLGFEAMTSMANQILNVSTGLTVGRGSQSIAVSEDLERSNVLK